MCDGINKSAAALLILLSLPWLIIAGPAETDLPRWDHEAKLGQPLFAIQTYQRFTSQPEKVRLDVVLEVMNDMLQFVRQDQEFIASVELNLSISSAGQGQIDRQVQYLDKKVSSFKTTNSRRDFLVGVFSTDLSPGRYTVAVVLIDQESRRRETIERKVDLSPPEPGWRVSVSDLMLARSSEADTERRLPLRPTVSGSVPDESATLYGYFDLLRRDPMEVCRLSLSVYDEDGEECYMDSLIIVGGAPLSAYFMPIRCSKLTFGRNEVVLRAESDGDTAESRTFFSVNFHGLPDGVRDIDQAILQMRYVATEEEIRRLIDTFPSQKERRFIDFWNENFQAPGEIVNGKMIEYYNRVSYANEHFQGSRDGWETDRGRILLIYGRPTEIDRHGIDEYETPYEIWYYSHLGKRFVFRDEYGFGEYRLVNQVW